MHLLAAVLQELRGMWSSGIVCSQLLRIDSQLRVALRNMRLLVIVLPPVLQELRRVRCARVVRGQFLWINS